MKKIVFATILILILATSFIKNATKEIEDRIKKYNDWGAQIITFIPKITIS